MLDKRYPGSESIRRETLPNGITILVYENFNSQSVVIEGIVRAGALQESTEKAGLAVFTADMLMRGMQGLDFDQTFELLESCGASLDFGGGRHLTQFSGHCLVEDVDLVLDLLVRALRTPLFPEPQIERLRGQILTGLKIRENDTQRMASLGFMETLYKDHPYGRSVHGYDASIVSITRDDLVDFYRHHFGPEGMIVAIVGAIRSEVALATIVDVLGDWNSAKQQPIPQVPEMPRPVTVVKKEITMPGKTQVDLVMGLPGPCRAAPDYLHASLMNTILGEFGMMGRIGQNLREEQGLAYYASSHLAGGLGPTPWSANAGAAPEDVEDAVDGIKLEIMRMQNELVVPSELADCQSYRAGSLPVSLETNTAIADTMVDMELYDLGLDFLQRFPDLIHSIGAEQIQAAAQKYLSSEQLVVAMAGPVRSEQC
ncbi:MAG: insulinase family protein [Anaerolineaceae bacterium]|nr:MAG: insulinase family protein [Anaerolineaceae bacterium]